MSSVVVTGVLVEEPNLKVLIWIRYTMIMYLFQFTYLISTLNENNVVQIIWTLAHYVLFGVIVPIIGAYGARKPNWPSLVCFSGTQSMLCVLNVVSVGAIISTAIGLAQLCSTCNFDKNTTCVVPFRTGIRGGGFVNQTSPNNITLYKSWCEESQTSYILPVISMIAIAYISFRSAVSARKMGKTKTIQVVHIDQCVPVVAS